METTDSLFLCLNFEGENIPTRIQLIPPEKTIKGRDGRTWKNANPAQIALNSDKRLALKPIDENHSTDLAAPKGGSSPAFGWFKNMNAEADGSIWADVEWNDLGRDALLKKKYRYISPVFLNNEAGEITCVLRAALTNTPNLQLPALNSETSEKTEKICMEDLTMNKELCAALGLPETATEAEILAAVKAQKAQLNSAKPTPQVDLAAYAPRADLSAMETRALAAEKQLAELNAAQLKTEAEAAVEEAVKARKIAPASVPEYLNLCATREGLESFKKIVAASPAVIGTETQAPEGAPPSTAKAQLNAEDEAMAKAMGYTAEEYAKIKEAGK